LRDKGESIRGGFARNFLGENGSSFGSVEETAQALARKSAISILRPIDLDQTDPHAWVYKPTRKKGKKKGKDRFVYFGPAAQEILAPWLEGVGPEAWVFSPQQSEALRNAERRQKRRTKKRPSHEQRNEKKRKTVRKRNYSAHMKTHAVGVAIRRACQKLDERMRRERNPDDKRKSKEVPKADRLFPHWHVHQIRHTAGTRVRREFGAEVAQIFLGHSQLSTTEIYAEPDREAVKKAVAKLG
jgi:integrase